MDSDSENETCTLTESISNLSAASIDQRISNGLLDSIIIKEKHYCRLDKPNNVLHKCQYCTIKRFVNTVNVKKALTPKLCDSIIKTAAVENKKGLLGNDNKLLRNCINQIMAAGGLTDVEFLYRKLEKDGIVSHFWLANVLTTNKFFQKIVFNNEVLAVGGHQKLWYHMATDISLNYMDDNSYFGHPIFLIFISTCRETIIVNIVFQSVLTLELSYDNLLRKSIFDKNIELSRLNSKIKELFSD